MLFYRTGFGIFTSAKKLFTPHLGTNFYRNMFDASYKYSKYKAVFLKMYGHPDVNFRSFWTSRQSKVKMVTLTFLRHDGVKIQIEAETGKEIHKIFEEEDILRDAFPNVGLCEGTISCASCHVIVTENLIGKLGEVSQHERDALDETCHDLKLSRLGCCLTVIEEMDGTVLTVPKYEIEKQDDS